MVVKGSYRQVAPVHEFLLGRVYLLHQISGAPTGVEEGVGREGERGWQPEPLRQRLEREAVGGQMHFDLVCRTDTYDLAHVEHPLPSQRLINRLAPIARSTERQESRGQEVLTRQVEVGVIAGGRRQHLPHRSQVPKGDATSKARTSASSGGRRRLSSLQRSMTSKA